MPEHEVAWDVVTFPHEGRWAWRAMPVDRGGYMGSSGWAISEEEAIESATRYATHATNLVRNTPTGRMVTRIVV